MKYSDPKLRTVSEGNASSGCFDGSSANTGMGEMTFEGAVCETGGSAGAIYSCASGAGDEQGVCSSGSLPSSCSTGNAASHELACSTGITPGSSTDMCDTGTGVIVI